MKELVKKLNGNIELQKNINTLVDENGQEEFNSLRKKVKSLFSRDCE